jgi:membrane protease YdiL (CAAX protease family)
MMSVTNKSIVFLALAFALSWGVAIGGWALGAADDSLGAFATLTLMMAGPAVSAVICAFTFEKGRRIEALGLHFRPNRWWLFAYLVPLALGAISVAATVLLSDRTLADIGANAVLAAEQAGQDVSQLRAIESYLPAIILGQALIVGGIVNSVALTFTEELGWRGYLHGLWRGSGFWRTSLATGVVWGVWHVPAIYLFGLNYPNDRALGLGLFVLFCVLLSPLMALVRDRGGSVWAAGILHGMINAIGGVTALALSNPAFPWNGIVGIGGYIALALGVVFVALVQPPARPVAA